MKIDHAALYARDLEAAAAFFARYFGGEIGPLYRNETTGFLSRFLTFEGGSRLELMSRPVLGDRAAGDFSVGYEHLAFSVGGRDQVDQLTQRLREDGFPVLSGPRVTGDGYYESRVADGEGNLIEITE